MQALILKLVMGMLMKLIAEKPLEDLTILILEKLSKSTVSNVDDQVVEIVKKAIKGE